MYSYAIDFDRIEAIDIHTHVEIDGHGHRAYDDALIEATAKYFKMPQGIVASVDTIADQYRRHNTAAVVFTIDARHGMRHPPNSIEDLVLGAERNNDVLIPFGSVDPHQGRHAVHRVHELVRDFGVKGFKFHPSMQAFEPNDRAHYPIYHAIADAGVPALFHTGQTGMGSGLPGGYGIKLRYSDPMLLDDVAADFPELTIVMAHPAVPWVDAQIAIVTRIYKSDHEIGTASGRRDGQIERPARRGLDVVFGRQPLSERLHEVALVVDQEDARAFHAGTRGYSSAASWTED